MLKIFLALPQTLVVGLMCAMPIKALMIPGTILINQSTTTSASDHLHDTSSFQRQERNVVGRLATRSDGSGGGLSGGAIAGIIIAIFLILAIILVLFLRSRRSPAYGQPTVPTSKPYPITAQQTYLPQYTGPSYPAATHPSPGIGAARGGYMPPVTPGLSTQGVFYAPAPQRGTTVNSQVPPQRHGVRFGNVGVRNYS